MGTVIEFPKRKRQPHSNLEVDELRRSGEVMLFTGVRYTRMDPTRATGREACRAAVTFGEDHDATA